MNAEAVTPGRRCYYLDLAKVLATFLVILGHLYSEDSPVRLYLYAFHMPLFFLVSGVFHKDTGKVNWKGYSQALLWPALICIVLQALVRLIIFRDSLGNVSHFLFYDILLGRRMGVFWFILALFWCKVFLDVWLRFRKTTPLLILWAILLFVPILLNISIPLKITQGLMALPFYFLGFYFSSFLLRRTTSVRYMIVFLVCLVLTTLITRFHGRISMESVHFGQMARQFGFEPFSLSVPLRLLFLAGDVLLFYLNGIIGSILVLSLSLSSVSQWRFVSLLSRSLITVFGTQYLFIIPLERHFGLDHPLWISILLSIGIFALCYCLHLVLRPVYNLVR